MEQPVRKQVLLYILIICLKFQLLAGPCHLPEPIPYTVQNDQPLKDIKVTHKMDIHLAVCIYTNLSQVCKPGEMLALRKVQHPHNGRTYVNRFPLTKQDILSQYSSCFEGIGRFPGDPYKFHLKPDHKLARHAPRKVPVHLETAFKEEIDSLVSQGILEEVKEHTDWVNS